MNAQSYRANFRPTGEECVAIGDFTFDSERECIYIVLPNAEGKFALDSKGRAALDALQVSRTPVASGNRVWFWDGNESHPTLQPSINWQGNWHGYLTKGELKSC